LIEAGKPVAGHALVYENKYTGLKSEFEQAKAAVARQLVGRSTEHKTVSQMHY
jgi:hypothetical protein